MALALKDTSEETASEAKDHHQDQPSMKDDDTLLAQFSTRNSEPNNSCNNNLSNNFNNNYYSQLVVDGNEKAPLFFPFEKKKLSAFSETHCRVSMDPNFDMANPLPLGHNAFPLEEGSTPQVPRPQPSSSSVPNIGFHESHLTPRYSTTEITECLEETDDDALLFGTDVVSANHQNENHGIIDVARQANFNREHAPSNSLLQTPPINNNLLFGDPFDDPLTFSGHDVSDSPLPFAISSSLPTRANLLNNNKNHSLLFSNANVASSFPQQAADTSNVNLTEQIREEPFAPQVHGVRPNGGTNYMGPSRRHSAISDESILDPDFLPQSDVSDLALHLPPPPEDGLFVQMAQNVGTNASPLGDSSLELSKMSSLYLRSLSSPLTQDPVSDGRNPSLSEVASSWNQSSNPNNLPDLEVEESLPLPLGSRRRRLRSNSLAALKSKPPFPLNSAPASAPSTSPNLGKIRVRERRRSASASNEPISADPDPALLHGFENLEPDANDALFDFDTIEDSSNSTFPPPLLLFSDLHKSQSAPSLFSLAQQEVDFELSEPESSSSNAHHNSRFTNVKSSANLSLPVSDAARRPRGRPRALHPKKKVRKLVSDMSEGELERVRALNRQAAKRHREMTKAIESQQKKEYDELVSLNSHLQDQASKLSSEIQLLKDTLRTKVKEHPHLFRAPTSSNCPRRVDGEPLFSSDNSLTIALGCVNQFSKPPSPKKSNSRPHSAPQSIQRAQPGRKKD